MADLDLRFTGNILEIGAGRMGRRGSFEPQFATRATLTQLDIRKVNLPHIQADMEGLPFREGTFDTVICLEVIEYLKQPEKGLGELFRVMKHNSWLIMSTPFMHRQDAENDYWRLSVAGLNLLLGRTGFIGITTIPQGAAFAVVANTLKFCVHRVGNTNFRLWLGLLVYPVISVLNRLDRKWGRENKIIATFSTGYLAIAHKGAVK